VFLLSVFSSCFRYHDNDVSISIKEDDEEYRLSARFDDSKTRAVQNYIKDCTSPNSIFNHGGHNEIDATLTLDDNTRFYIKSYEGRLKIKLNKEENSEESCERIKEMCEGVKQLLAEN
jgi:hypothetical protein